MQVPGVRCRADPRGRAAETVLDRPARDPRRRSRRHARARRRGSLCRPARRRGGGREVRRRRRRGAAGCASNTRCCPRCSMPKRRCGRRAPVLHDKGAEARISIRSATSSPRSTGPAATSIEASPRPTSCMRKPTRRIGFSTRRWRPTRRIALARRRRRAQYPLQHPGAVPDPRRDSPGCSISTGQGARVLRAGRRRVRRQAGDPDRGHRRAGGAADRAPGEARADARGAVHGTTTRHPMKVTVKAGARTRRRIDRVADSRGVATPARTAITVPADSPSCVRRIDRASIAAPTRR